MLGKVGEELLQIHGGARRVKTNPLAAALLALKACASKAAAPRGPVSVKHYLENFDVAGALI